MPKKRIINQNIMSDVLPNFRNLGVVLRIVLLVNGIALFTVISQASSIQDVWQRIVYGSAFMQPSLLCCLLILYAINNILSHRSYMKGWGVVLISVSIVSWIIAALGGDLFEYSVENSRFHFFQHVMLSILVATVTLVYFRLRALSLSPAVANSRLQALQARIRPHFLFNSINAVLGVVRKDPKRAEQALEDMADLFRMAMADNRELVTLKREIELSRQYLALEQMRLEDRLTISWQLGSVPEDAMIPPLILQPLLENAVYHGIEPMSEGGEISIKINLIGKDLHLDVCNPHQQPAESHSGNKMALSNIRERLALQFDVEASYNVDEGNDFYHVHIIIPYVREEYQ